jgi:peptide/nickel transport system substrate-binding protein
MIQRLGILSFIGCFLISCGNKKPVTNNNTNDSTSIQAYRNYPDATTCDPSWSKENIVINHWLNEPPTLHPTNEYTSNRNFVFGYIHSYLLIVDLKTLDLKPDLVKSLPTISADGLTYEFELKPGITWDDGSPITAEDVIFTFKANACALTNNSFAKPYIESLLNVEAVAGSTTQFKFILKEKYILNDYIATYFPIMQRTLYDPKNIVAKYSMADLKKVDGATVAPELSEWAETMNGAMFGTEVAHITGSGPYKLESWEKGQTMVLTKKAKHWSAQQNPQDLQYAALPEKIIFKMIVDESALKIETNNQAIDVTTFISTKALLELEKNPEFVKNYHFGYLPAYNSTYLMMNNQPDGTNHKKLFNDKKVRLAMAYATPVEDVIKIVYFGKGDRLVGPMHPQKRGFNKNLPPIPLDLNKAGALLDEAGWKDTDNDGIRDKMVGGKKEKFEFKLMYPSDSPVAKDIADLVIETMKKAGINPIPDGLPMGELVPKATSHDFDMTFFAFGQSALPDDFEQLWGTQSWTSNGSNISGFGNAQSDALIDSIKTELDWNKRIPMMHRFQKLLYDEQPVIFFMASNRKIIIHKRFGNATMYYERPGVMLNNLKLLCSPASGTTNVQ